jgi:hypothetical protein
VGVQAAATLLEVLGDQKAAILAVMAAWEAAHLILVARVWVAVAVVALAVILALAALAALADNQTELGLLVVMLLPEVEAAVAAVVEARWAMGQVI